MIAFLLLITGAFACATFALLFPFRYLAEKYAFLLNYPNHRSSHTHPKVRSAGLIFIPTAMAYGALVQSSGADWRFTAGLLLLAAVSMADDVAGLPSLPRILTHSVCALMASLGLLQIVPEPVSSLYAVGICALSSIILVSFINVINFMDGIDGLVASVSCLVLAVDCLLFNQSVGFEIPLAIGTCAALLGFLPHNWDPSKVFMGDVGSTFLGYLLGYVALRQSVLQFSPVPLLLVLLLLLPLLADSFYTLCCRIRRGDRLFQAHRNHIYQKLVTAGFSHAQVSVRYLTASALFALASLEIAEMETSTLLLVVVTSYIAAIAVLHAIDTRLRLNRRPKSPQR